MISKQRGPSAWRVILPLSGASFLAIVTLSLVPGLWGANFGTVVPDQVYRSAQLSPDGLAERIEAHGLRTIINLRGEEEERAWYRAEAEVAASRGIVLHDIDLVPERLPPRPAVVDLLDALETLPRPILIHCAAGADRTGFASVVARMAVGGRSFAEARDQLSLRFGHLPLGPAAEIGRIFDLYASYLETSREPDVFATFDRWAREIYVPYGYSARLESEGRALPLVAGARERIELTLRITNTSPGAWVLSSDPSRGVKLGVRLRAEADEAWIDYDRHGQIDGRIDPGDALRLEVSLFAPSEDGTYDVKLDLVDEHVTWFEDQGSTPLRFTLEVTASEPQAGLDR